jgi:hypothetical protein
MATGSDILSKNQIARDISYASSAQTKGGRAVIRVMENATGRLKLIRKVRGYDAEVAQGADFWRVITDRYKLTCLSSVDRLMRSRRLAL